MADYALADLALSQRLERCEGKTNAAFVEARARLQPDLGASWIECAGAYAMFDGIGSPLTQTFGLGIFATPTDADLDTIEQFFDARGAAVFHEVSPIAPMETIELLVRRGYRPVELTSVMHRPAFSSNGEGRVQTRMAAAEEGERWSHVAAEGWSEFPDLIAFVRDMGRVWAASNGMSAFFAELDGQAIGTGAVGIYDGVAILAGASTIPTARKQGAQKALLQARLRHAAEQGCDLAMMCAAPGSASQRNAERQGFRIAYTRIKWGR
ncbi:MAG TPA: GNAT family N-acetyltransferase [Thermoanaerobaculia bacterium]|jgi:GNAT superfamily N-acetyltransferase|nr:GNAT family N-acetyltransferase [Thermoanaerobaculia bacterium]